tara:strand:- start:595 stop:1425 length:831 start_codon:yes stop_codon:yes gene_type:complete
MHDRDNKNAAEPEEGHIPDHPEGEDFDVDIEVEIDEDDMPGGKRDRETFNTDAIFGPEGVFGPGGPFGPSGPFGPDGPFGKSGPFGEGGPFGGGRRGNRARWKSPGAYDAGRHAHREPHRERRRKRMFGPGELRLVLLALIAGENKHGYELIKEIEDLTGGEYSPSPGVIYPTLSLLEDEGRIAPVEGDETRKAFRVTDSGMEELEDRSGEVARLMQRLGKQARHARPQGSPDLLRALGNLATVITNRAANGQFSGENKDKVVDLIDELARKIERL